MPLRTLEGPGSAARAHHLRARFQAAQQPRRVSRLARLGHTVVVVYWASCLIVIALGLSSLQPGVGGRVAAWLESLPIQRARQPTDGAW